MSKEDSRLKEYRRKRDMSSTPEPFHQEAERSGHPVFVIQKHHARNLHYDFRLEDEGVLKSWAVPKGPSTNPSEKRLAIATEDHPLTYASFEGIIPEGNYGAGTVLVWDQGTYENTTEEKGTPIRLSEGVDQGRITFHLQGQKLTGGYALIRTGQSQGKHWLLVKMTDRHADAERDPVDTEPKSVLTGRTLEEIQDQA